ncbi:hypothetical protein GCM10010387_23540 [Streptomyces inusitatus]|uniref:Oligopeptide/dipeptide ABC transporter C-terminal domain-containing protein n=1 Tax=Streptomyces inusitatus TaxID=68221 RepID=A0A918Q1R3_9ACTN|nr:hypothetical protein [Streptomyces inusitatus]GGZ29455.1 hypothetical protein GCM10010387_23540 [Streptomyces inusitatus]
MSALPAGGTRTVRGRTADGPGTGLPLAVAVLLACAAPGLLAHASPTAADPLAALLPPGPDHWFGTDQLGRDVYARVVHGARHSLLLGLVATALGVLAGLLVGLPSALLGRVADQVAMRGTDIALALPELLLALLVMHEGRAVESGPVAEVLGAPRHPYTRRLLASVPRLPVPPPSTAAGRGPAAPGRGDPCPRST